MNLVGSGSECSSQENGQAIRIASLQIHTRKSATNFHVKGIFCTVLPGTGNRDAGYYLGMLLNSGT